jgi:glycosyltransferase involved in cell wall biosynthesis
MRMAQHSTVAVVVTTKDRPARLWTALEGVAAQTHPVSELVVVNDGGVPVEDVIQRYTSKFGFPIQQIFVPESRGVAAARNTGVSATSSDFIALLDDDDSYTPTHIAQLVSALDRTPNGVLAYDDVLIQLEHETAD